MKKRVFGMLMAAAMLTSTVTVWAEAEASYELPESIEVQTCNIGYLPVEKDGAVYNFYKDILGFGIEQPYIEWNGGTTYQEQINLRVISGDAPDVYIIPNGSGMEEKLIKDGALLDLTDYLEEYAPHVWELVPDDIWESIRNSDPTGEGRIWYVPAVVNYTRHGAMIRKDWLDKLGLEIPTTQEEFVNVLKAFKEQDPNGNGIADEIPTGGRAEARWMDYLFNMYGVASFEGYPSWDLYDGELTYSAVTQNMKDALEFVAGLYAEGLLDPETLLNDKAAWDGKVRSDLVGVFYQWPEQSYNYAMSIKDATGAEAEWVVLPPIEVEGYEGQGFYQAVKSGSAQFVVNNTDDLGTIVACLTAIDACYNEEYAETFYYGVEGMHHIINEAGEKEILPDDMTTQEFKTLNVFDVVANTTTVETQLNVVKTEETAVFVDQAIENMKEVQQYGKVIAGNNIPTSIYTDYEDIQNRKLFVEYASKIIAGEYSIDKFDEFVEEWYATGGEEVTARAREWYAAQAQ